MSLGGLFAAVFTGGRYGGSDSLGPTGWETSYDYGAEKAASRVRWNPYDDPYYQALAQQQYDRHIADQQAAQIQWGQR